MNRQWCLYLVKLIVICKRSGLSTLKSFGYYFFKNDNQNISFYVNTICMHPLLVSFTYSLPYLKATVGPCNVPKPGFWDMVGKSKWYEKLILAEIEFSLTLHIFYFVWLKIFY